MEMKLKLGEILNLNQTLKLMIDDADTKIDALFKFRLLGIMKSLEPHIANFETIRNEKIREYGKTDEDGNISIPQEDEATVKKFSDDLMRVIDSEVSVNVSKLKAGDVFDQGVKAEHLMRLYPVIEE